MKKRAMVAAAGFLAVLCVLTMTALTIIPEYYPPGRTSEDCLFNVYTGRCMAWEIK